MPTNAWFEEPARGGRSRLLRQPSDLLNLCDIRKIAELSAIADVVLDEAVVASVVSGVVDVTCAGVVSSDMRWRSSLTAVELEIRNLTRAIAEGGELSSLLDELRACEQRRTEVQRAISNREQVQEHTVDQGPLEAVVRRKLETCGPLTRRTQHGRQQLREMLGAPIRIYIRSLDPPRFEEDPASARCIGGEAD